MLGDGGINGCPANVDKLSMTTSTDPATNAATAASIVGAFAGTIITTTTTGNSQTLASPTDTTAGKVFTIVNDDTSTNTVPVVANSVTYTIAVGTSESFMWEGTKWIPYDMGITTIPIPYNQGGTGVADDLANYCVYVDGSRSDTYTADGSIARPYKTVLAALTVINADTGKNWVMHVASGTYSDNLTITGPRYLSIRGQGVVLSGTILINSGVGSYDRIEFKGTDTGQCDKGPALTLSGAITLNRTNDSLIYLGFSGCYVSGAMSAAGSSGTWTTHYTNCRVSGAITGPSLGVGTETIHLTTYGYNKFAGTISGKVNLYNCVDTEFACTINTVPQHAQRVLGSQFTGAITMAAGSALVLYADSVSLKAIVDRTPTLTDVTLSNLDYAGTETYPGVNELATDAETITGTATDRVTTPANITARLASPPAIGGTAPAAIKGTTIDATTDITLIGSTGGYVRKFYEATANITASASVTITLNIPTVATILGCQLRVDSALATGETWDAAYSGGSTEAICTAQAVAANTKVNSFTTDITDNTTNIAITKNGGGNFTAQGTIRAIVYVEFFDAMASL